MIYKVIDEISKSIQESLRRKLNQEPFILIFIFLILNFSVLSLSISQGDPMAYYVNSPKGNRGHIQNKIIKEGLFTKELLQRCRITISICA